MQTSIGKKIFNWLKRPLLLALLVIAIIIGLQQINLLPAFKNWFQKKPLVIDDTPLVITQVKNIAQLNTVQLYAEVVADSTIVTQAGMANTALRSMGMLTLPMAETKTLVLIVKGKVKAGIDLKFLSDKDIFTKDDSVAIKLPAAQILEVITNPADIETFVESGKWQNEQIQAVKASARRHLLELATEQKLLQQANNRCKLVVEDFLKASGFTKINIVSSER